jgi:TFIIF-interacting CTD phosphatase-like protein
VRILDTTNAVASLLYRQHCTPLNGVYVKDLSLLGRDMKDIILVDVSVLVSRHFAYNPI